MSFTWAFRLWDRSRKIRQGLLCCSHCPMQPCWSLCTYTEEATQQECSWAHQPGLGGYDPNRGAAQLCCMRCLWIPYNLSVSFHSWRSPLPPCKADCTSASSFLQCWQYSDHCRRADLSSSQWCAIWQHQHYFDEDYNRHSQGTCSWCAHNFYAKHDLNSFGPIPFSVVALRSHLQSFNPATSFHQDSSNPPDPVLLPSSSPPTIEEPESSDNAAVPIGDLLTCALPDSSLSLEPTDADNLLSVDAASVALGEKILGLEQEIPNDPEFDSTLHSRVLKDLFHVFNMFYLSTAHPLWLHFTRELCNAIFVPGQADKSRIDSWGALQNPPQTYNTLWNSSPQWVREQCKHIIPAPKKLWHLVSQVFRTYGPLIDPWTKKPLFTTDNWKTAKHVLDLIQNGYLSDPPGIPLYTVVGLDKKSGGLSLYRCARGTNATEGGVHKHIRAQLPKCGASIRHVNACLHDFVLYHNLVVCAKLSQSLPSHLHLFTKGWNEEYHWESISRAPSYLGYAWPSSSTLSPLGHACRSHCNYRLGEWQLLCTNNRDSWHPTNSTRNPRIQRNHNLHLRTHYKHQNRRKEKAPATWFPCANARHMQTCTSCSHNGWKTYVLDTNDQEQGIQPPKCIWTAMESSRKGLECICRWK